MVVMGDTPAPVESLPDAATFRRLLSKDLEELARKNELEPSPSIDKIQLQAFLWEHLDLVKSWEELKEQDTYEREAEKREKEAEKEALK